MTQQRWQYILQGLWTFVVAFVAELPHEHPPDSLDMLLGPFVTATLVVAGVRAMKNVRIGRGPEV